MERNIDMKEVSDGKLYTSNDMVKADCGGCEGCSACCCGMGESIVLDPLDIHRLCCGLETDFNGLMVDKIELNIVDCLILPNLKMAGEKEACSFLNKDGRCSIHGFRPGICRLFPLGRIYEDGFFKYFLQVHECPKQDKTKVKVKKWLDTPDLKQYEAFVRDWHYYLKDLEAQVKAAPEQMKAISMGVLQRFYLTPYAQDGNFYEEFYERLKTAKNA